MNLSPELSKSLELYLIQLNKKVSYAQIEKKIKKMIQIGFKGLVKNAKIMSIAKIKLLTIFASKEMLNDELKENKSCCSKKIVVCKRIKTA